MYTLNCKGRIITIDKPIVMGIINVTPDSFYEGSRKSGGNILLEEVHQMLQEGATIIDIGGQSTRPNSIFLNCSEEADRVLPAIEMIVEAYPNIILSIDTFHADVARQAVHAGASLVNDISAGNLDDKMLSTVGLLHVPYIMMHMKGTPQTMQQNPVYEKVAIEVLDYLIAKKEACRQAGIKDIIVDPGFGFGKTTEHNFTLLKQLKILKMLDLPILAGLSRKGMIYKTIHSTPREALNGTTALNSIALLNGASILRVHDVKEAVECIQMVSAYNLAN